MGAGAGARRETEGWVRYPAPPEEEPMKQIENCRRCGRPLHLPLSKARGYGIACWRRRTPQQELWSDAELNRLNKTAGGLA